MPAMYTRSISSVGTAGLESDTPYRYPAADSGTATTAVGENSNKVTTTKAPATVKRTEHTDQVVTYSPQDVPQYERQLEYLRNERDDLLDVITSYEREDMRLSAYVVGDPAALYILSRIVEVGAIDVATLHENLNAPDGWIAFSKLASARLVECHGPFVLSTTEGEALINIVEAAVSKLKQEGSSR